MKKNFKLVLALVLSIMMILGSVAALADVTASIQSDTNNLITGHTFTAYQIFTGTQAESEGGLGDVKWGNGINASAFLTAVKADSVITAVTYTEDSQTKTVGTLLNAITYDSENPNASALALTAALGKINSDTAAANRLAELALANKTGSGTSVPTDGTAIGVAKGYYLIVDETTDLDADNDGVNEAVLNAALLQVTDALTIRVKTDKPDVDKRVDSDNDQTFDTTDAYYNNTSIGDRVPYIIKATVPDLTYYKKYYLEFADTMSAGLTLNKEAADDTENGISVKIGGNVLTADQFEATYSVNSTTKVTSINVKIDDLKALIATINAVDGATEITTGSLIEVSYSATVNTDAIIGETGNPNTVKLIYTNKPDHSGDGEYKTVTGETPDHKTITYVSEFALLKIDGTTGSPLANAEFTLTSTENLENIVKVTKESFEKETNADPAYYKLKDGTFTKTAPDSGTVDQYDNTDKYKKVLTSEWKHTKADTPEAATVTTGADGIIRFSGLKAGTYTLTETNAPNGYNFLEAPVYFTLTCADPTTAVPSTGTETCNWTASATYKGSALTVANNGVDGNDVFQITIENNKGSTLPETGGIGTTIFYIAGSVLVLAAAILLITKRRMSNND